MKSLRKYVVFLFFFLLFFSVSNANATLITKNFSVVIESADPIQFWATGVTPKSVGEVYYGTITYDDFNIPSTGDWIIGNANIAGQAGLGIGGYDETQYTLYMQLPNSWPTGGTVVAGDPYNCIREISFTDGEFNWNDFWVTAYDYGGGMNGVEFIQINNMLLSAWGYWTDNTGLSHRWDVTGRLRVSEPATILLLGFSLVGLVGFRRKLKKV